MVIHIRFGGVGGNKHTVMEGRHQDAAVERPKMHVTVEFTVHGSVGFPAVARRRLAEPVFDPEVETLNNLGQVELFDNIEHTGFVTVGQFLAAFEHGRGQNVFERSTHGGNGQGITCQSAADTAHVGLVQLQPCPEGVRDFLCETVDTRREPPASGLPQVRKSGLRLYLPV